MHDPKRVPFGLINATFGAQAASTLWERGRSARADLLFLVRFFAASSQVTRLSVFLGGDGFRKLVGIFSKPSYQTCIGSASQEMKLSPKPESASVSGEEGTT